MSFEERVRALWLCQANKQCSEPVSYVIENVEISYRSEIGEFHIHQTNLHDVLDTIQSRIRFRQQLSEIVDKEIKKQEAFLKDIQVAKMHIGILEKSVEKVERLLGKKEVQDEELQQSLAVLKGQLQSIMNEKTNLAKLRQEILTYKLLTRIDLVFGSKKVVGLILKDDPKDFKFNPEVVPLEEVTKQMWNLILED